MAKYFHPDRFIVVCVLIDGIMDRGGKGGREARDQKTGCAYPFPLRVFWVRACFCTAETLVSGVAVNPIKRFARQVAKAGNITL